ncbi:MAG: hypothetical protein ACOYVK_00440 [Bacillota bacterium]
MFERFKDFMYDTSDLLLAFVIIFVMSSVITWKVSDSLAFSRDNGSVFNQIAQENDQMVENQESLPPDEGELVEQSAEEPKENLTPSQAEQTPNVQETPANPSPDIVVEVQPPQQDSAVQIVIPSGTAGIGIAKILTEKGLISDPNQFTKRAEELKLASKLRSGTFSIPTGTSLDDIIGIISNTKK